MEMDDDEPQLRMTDMDSFIEIELYQENSYTSGQPLYGTVHLFVKDKITDVK